MPKKRLSEYLYLANQLGLMFFGCDRTMTRWYFVSEPLLELFGINGKEIDNKPDVWIEKTPSRLRDQLRTDFESAGTAGGNGYVTFSFSSEGSGERVLKCHYCPFPAADETFDIQFICTVEDVTDSTMFEREAARAQDYDIEVSARIQKALLTDTYFHDTEWIQIAAETVPSSKVDGDFFEFIQLDDTSIDFIIGDVMGKGISAALLAAAVKTSFLKCIIASERQNRGLPEIGTILSNMDSAIGAELVKLENFLTLYYCRLQLDPPAIRYIDAGHTCFVYYCAADGTCWTVKGSNMPVGFMSQQIYRQFILPLSEGDVLLFYSDGITEIMDSEGEQFGSERLMHLISANHDLETRDILKKILNVSFYFASSEFKDDVTAVVIKSTTKINDPLKECRFGEMTLDTADLTLVRESFEYDISIYLQEKQNTDAFTIALIEAVGNSLVHTGKLNEFSWRIYDGLIEATLDWNGVNFDWYSTRVPNISDYQESGFGMYILQTIADSVVLMDGIGNRKRMVIVKELK